MYYIFITNYYKHVGKSSNRNMEVERYFLRSFSLFWPHEVANTPLRIIVDSEVIGSHVYNNLNNSIRSYSSRLTGGGIDTI